MKIRSFFPLVMLIMPTTASSDQAPARIVGGTVVEEWRIDPSSINLYTYFALAQLSGMPQRNLEAMLPRSNTGDAFTDARNKRELVERIEALAQSFSEIQGDGVLGFYLAGVSLNLEQPRLNSGSRWIDGTLHQVHGQGLCGLPSMLRLSTGRSEMVRGIQILYPDAGEGTHIANPGCHGGRPPPEQLGTDPFGLLRFMDYNASFDYVFTRLEAGERMFRRFQEHGLVADVACTVHNAGRASEHNPTCVAFDVAIRAGSGETVWNMRWENETQQWVEEWGSINPLPY